MGFLTQPTRVLIQSRRTQGCDMGRRARKNPRRVFSPAPRKLSMYGLDAGAERTQQIQDQDHDQYGADDAATADRAKSRIAEAAASQEHDQKNNKKQRHETTISDREPGTVAKQSCRAWCRDH